MKIKISEATNKQIDYLVAQCEGRTGPYWMNDGIYGTYSPTTYWGLGGPILEKEKISTVASGKSSLNRAAWFATKEPYAHEDSMGEHGPTPLMAAMRCYVASKLGDEVEIPEDLA